MKLKFPLLLLAVAATVVAVIALKNGKLQSGAQTETIVILGEDSSNLKAYATLSDDFTKKTGIRLRFEGATFEQSVQKADADFRNGKGDYDIVLQYNFSLAPYVRNQYVARIEDVVPAATLNKLHINEDMFQNALQETSFYYSNPQDSTSPAKQFGFPFAANTMLMVYNKDLFDSPELRSAFKRQTGRELQPPREWNEYLEVAEFFAHTRMGLKGVCMQGAADGWLYYEMANYLFGMGSGTSHKQRGWEETSALSIATPENAAVLRYVKRLRATSAGDFFTVGASQQQEIMLQGKVAMALMWSDYLLPLVADNSGKAPHFGFAPVPGKMSGLAGGAFYLNRKSRHLPAAAQFVLFALEPENQKKLIERGLISASRSAYTDAVLAKVPYAQALRISLERGGFMFEAGTDAEIINSALTTYTQKYMRGEISEVQALSLTENEVRAKRAQVH